MVPRPAPTLSDSGPLRVAVTLEQCWHRVPGGTARAAIDLVAALQSLGHVPGSADPSGAATTRPLDLVGVSAWHRQAPDPAFQPPVEVRALRLSRRMLYETWHRLRWPSVTAATGPVDLVHATGLVMPPAAVPVVWTLHDLAFLREPGHFTRHGLRFFHAALERALADAALVVCSSEATHRDAIDAGFAAERLRVVPLGAKQVVAGAEAVTRVRARHGLTNRYVLHVGTAEPRKNLRTLIEAMATLPQTDVQLVLAGPAGWGPDLEVQLNRLGDRVRRVGFVSEGDRSALYAGAAVFCYPSLWEGFGLPVLEAMVQGAPTVTSRATATEEVAGDAALLVDPTDVTAVRDAISRILDDPATAARLRAAGPMRAAEFTWERTAEATAAIYAEVAGGSS